MKILHQIRKIKTGERRPNRNLAEARTTPDAGAHRTTTEGSQQSSSPERRPNRVRETYWWVACLLQAAGTEISYGREKQNGCERQYRDRANEESVMARRLGVKTKSSVHGLGIEICWVRKCSHSRDPGGALPKRSGGRLHKERSRRPDWIKKDRGRVS
jgi:hypothetical protein